MRQPIIAGNWKMNKLIPEAVALVEALKKKSPSARKAEVFLAPPFTALGAVKTLLDGSGMQLAGQNICSEAAGAYTGEVSAAMLKDAGCVYVILGHSERRKIFGEDDRLVNKKIKTALTHGLKVIFCLGETLEERESGQATQVVQRQLEKGLEGFSAPELKNLVVAYEPVWAIGTGKNATPDQAQEVHAFLRARLSGVFGRETGDAMRILYGGSVTPDSSAGLLSQNDIDGALVGGASLNADSFYAIINSVN